MAVKNESTKAKSTKTKASKPKAGKATTSEAKVESNRRNAKRSTGPKTTEGKAASSRNSTKHGMTADPRKSFFKLDKFYQQHVDALKELIQPRNVIEKQCVKEIAAAMFRLDQVKSSEPAMMEANMLDSVDLRKGAKQWLQKIHGWWNTLKVEGVVLRPGLEDLDEQWDLMTTTPEGACALHHLLKDLWECLQEKTYDFHAFHAQQLAWLLGEEAARLNGMRNMSGRDPRDLLPADHLPRCGKIDNQIAAAKFRQNKDDENNDHELASRIQGQLRYFEQIANPYHVDSVMSGVVNKVNAARLLDADRQDLLLRYDKAASNKFKDAVRMLCELRGVQSLSQLIDTNKSAEHVSNTIADEMDLPKRNGLLNGNGQAHRNGISQN
jgi:hypothetical protein